MSKRQSRLELLASYFPELTEQKSRSDREQIVKFNTVAVGIILSDQILQFSKGFDRYGPGVLAIRIHQKDAEYLPVDILEEDEELARKEGNTEIADALREGIKLISEGNFNFNKGAVIMLVDESHFEFLVLDKEDPTGSVKAMFEEFT